MDLKMNINFDLFEKALENFEKFEASKEGNKKAASRSANGGCAHLRLEKRHGIETCTACGEILKKTVAHGTYAGTPVQALSAGLLLYRSPHCVPSKREKSPAARKPCDAVVFFRGRGYGLDTCPS